MKTISIPLLVLLASICTGGAASESPMADLIVKKRAAAIHMTIKMKKNSKGNDRGHSWGVFISDDGLALMNLIPLCTAQKPAIETANGTKLKFGSILGVFPNEGLALMKFDHRPKHWLRLASKDPDISEDIALVTIDMDNTMRGVGPPLIGPIMSKRSAVTVNRKVDQFMKVLSFGVGLTPKQTTALNPGWFAINGDGELVAFFQGMLPTGRNLLIHLSPVAQRSDRIKELAKNGKVIPFPLPEDINPVDPAVLDGDWRTMVVAFQRGDIASLRRLHGELVKRYPTSYQLRTILSKMGVGDPVLAPVGAPSTKAVIPVCHQIDKLLPRINVKLGKNDINGALADMKKLVALCPEDFPGYRAQLAHLYRESGRNKEALISLEKAYASCPESIEMATNLKMLYIKQSRLKSADKLGKRIPELEEIYRGR